MECCSLTEITALIRTFSFSFRVQKMPYDGPGGQYMSGSPDGSRPGVFQVNVIRPQDK